MAKLRAPMPGTAAKVYETEKGTAVVYPAGLTKDQLYKLSEKLVGKMPESVLQTIQNELIEQELKVNLLDLKSNLVELRKIDRKNRVHSNPKTEETYQKILKILRPIPQRERVQFLTECFTELEMKEYEQEIKERIKTELADHSSKIRLESSAKWLADKSSRLTTEEVAEDILQKSDHFRNPSRAKLAVAIEELKLAEKKRDALKQRTKNLEDIISILSSKDCVKLYLFVLNGLYESISKMSLANNPGGPGSYYKMQEIRGMWASLNQARIINLGDLYPKLIKSMDDKRSINEQDYQQLVINASQQPLDVSHLPFNQVFYMFDEAYTINEQYSLFGYLVTHEGVVYSIRCYFDDDNDSPVLTEKVRDTAISIDFCLEKQSGSNWESGENAFIVSSLIQYTNEYRTFIEEHPPPLYWKRPKKGKRAFFNHPIPKPYYTIYLKSEILEKEWNQKSGQISYQFQHRFDRRGHERCYIQRGNLPLEPKLRKKLLEADYRIYTVELIPEDDLRRLAERGMAIKSAGEWVAIKSRWIEADIIPHNQKLPYVPAVRKPSKKHLGCYG